MDATLNLPIREEHARQVYDACKPLVDEIAEKNRVDVVVHRFTETGKRWNWSAGDLVYSSRTDAKPGDTAPTLAALFMADQARMLVGKKPIFVDQAVRLTGGELRDVSFNTRVYVGTDYVAAQLGGAASTTVATNIGLSNATNTLDPTLDTATRTGVTTGSGINWGTSATTDATAATTGRGEYVGSGMSRAAAAYAHTTGTNVTNYTMTKTFTAGVAVTSVQVCGLFTGATQGTGTLFVENNFTATSLAINDQLTITWTVGI